MGPLDCGPDLILLMPPGRLLRGKRPQPPNIFLPTNITARVLYSVALTVADIFSNYPRRVIVQFPATTDLPFGGKEVP